MKPVIIIAIAFVLLIPVTVFATDGYVSEPDENIKITYSEIIKSDFGDTVVGTVKNTSDKQLDKIIILIGEHTSRFLEHSTMPFISSLRPNESSYFAIPVDSLTDCYELSVMSYNQDISSDTYSGQGTTQIFDNLSIDSFEITDNGIHGTVKNMDEKTKQIGVLIVAYNNNEIVDYGTSYTSDQIPKNKTFDFGYWMLPEKYQEVNSNNNISYDVIAKFDVVDRADGTSGTKLDKFYPISEIHRSQNLKEIPFTDEDYKVGTCEKGELVTIESETNEPQIPEWVKNNARWWGNDEIDDSTFVSGIQFLIKEDILKVVSNSNAESSSDEIPPWIRNNAKWWAEGAIDDEAFIQGIKYLVEQGIIQV